ncbi:hypothetical protein [Gryllotalpicola protaetiae]|uniref:hypothetical protein n=1 Tax=Gryllotalpicola protaetiae TaxID=2419771 RepID=UPI0013C4B4A1|nr:hypothetical protein [Gryllotalpicola protaetiae]
MARHRLSPRRVPFLARARRPALLGGVLGGGTALVIGVVTCAVLSTTSVGVHFTFVDRAEAAVIGVTHDQPAVTRDLATAGSPRPTPTSTPTPSAAAKTAARAASSASAAAQAAEPDASPSATPAAASSAAPIAPVPSPSSSPSPAPSPSSAPSSSPTSIPSQQPTSQPSNPPSDDGCVLVVFCF